MGLRLGLVAVLVFVWTAETVSQGAVSPVTIQGVVIDVPNYVESGMTPGIRDRKSAPELSVKPGDPIGILERGTGRIYLVTMDQKDTSAAVTLQQYLGIHVRAKGRIYRRGGVQLFVISDIARTEG